MVTTKNQDTKDNFEINLGGKLIKHQKEVTVLGITLTQDLTWDRHLVKNLMPAIQNRVQAFKRIAPYLGPNFKKVYANSIYRSKLFYGIETWGPGKLGAHFLLPNPPPRIYIFFLSLPYWQKVVACPNEMSVEWTIEKPNLLLLATHWL